MVTIGFSSADYTTIESNLTVCVSVLNGQLGPNVNVTYTVMTINNTASGKMNVSIIIIDVLVYRWMRRTVSGS